MTSCKPVSFSRRTLHHGVSKYIYFSQHKAVTDYKEQVGRPVSILGQPNPFYIPTSHLLDIHPNIIHTSTPRSPQSSPSLRFPHQDPIHPLSPHPYVPHFQPISFFSILSPAKYWVRSTNHLAPRYSISSILLLPRPSRSKYSPQHHVLKHPQLPDLYLLHYCTCIGVKYVTCFSVLFPRTVFH